MNAVSGQSAARSTLPVPAVYANASTTLAGLLLGVLLAGWSAGSRAFAAPPADTASGSAGGRQIVKGDSIGEAYFRTEVGGKRHGLISDDTSQIKTPLSAGEKVERLADQLRGLGCNLYLYLLRPHPPAPDGAADLYWEEFKHVVAALRDADPARNVDIMLYLYAPVGGMAHVAPHGADYSAWASAAAALSVDPTSRYANLRGIVIDDFSYQTPAANRQAFTPEQVTAFTGAGRGINPQFKFYMIAYYSDIAAASAFKIQDYVGLQDQFGRPCLDGLIVPYLNQEHLGKSGANSLVYSQEPSADRRRPGNDLALQLQAVRARCPQQMELLAMIYDTTLAGYASPRPSDVRQSTRAALELARQGVIAGVVQHDLPKQPYGLWPLYPLIRELYHAY